jgi:uncharacterized protein YndB with AHSA1/START domain
LRIVSNTDRIEKRVLLRAPRERVWRAISDSSQFGTWFGVELDGPFVVGATVVGKIVPTAMDAEVAKSQEPYRGVRFEFAVDRIEPLRLFSFRWHPYAGDRGVDYAKEPTTLVEFELEEVAGGTMLRITESGFDQLPLARRTKAFAGNEQGWTAQLTLIEKYLALGGEG